MSQIKIVKEIPIRESEPARFNVYYNNDFKDVFVFKPGHIGDPVWCENKAFDQAREYAAKLKESNGELTIKKIVWSL